MAKRKTLKERTTQKKRKTKKRTPTKLQFVKIPSGGYRDKNTGKVYSDLEGAELLMNNKATLSKWKGGKKTNDTSYEGGKYTGGRKSGTPNLKRTPEGKLLNQYGVEFTLEDKKTLEREVNKANKTRMEMLEEEGELPRLSGGNDTGQKVKNLQAMGKESDFIISRRSKSLQRFKSREDFEYYMNDLKRINSPTYLDDRIRLYKKNHMTALKNVFGDDAKDVMMKIRMMKPRDYMKLLQSEEDLEINYIYDPSLLAGKLNTIRTALGMKTKEEPIPDELIPEELN